MISFFQRLLAVLSTFVFVSAFAAPWTTTYHFYPRQFIPEKQGIHVQKKTQQPFTQLLVSWNAGCPVKGHYCFILDVYDEQKKAWTSYRMYEWGADRQRSFLKKSKTGAHYAHVRFEGAPERKYHRFRVHVQAHNGAALRDLRAISVCASDLPAFVTEPLDEFIDATTVVEISGVPLFSQQLPEYPESSGWCSPASLAQVISFYCRQSVDLPSFARQVYDEGLQVYGSWPFNTAMVPCYLPESLSYVTRLNSLHDLIKLLKQNVPVIVSIHSKQALPGAPKAYDKGHLITVIGIDMPARQIICHDTAEAEIGNVYKRYPLAPFLQAWENRKRLAYVIKPRVS